MEELINYFTRIDEYESFYETPKIQKTQEDIFEQLKNTIIQLDLKQKTELTPTQKKLLFIKKCVVRQILDDLLSIPEEVRPWPTNEQKWLTEMEAREKPSKVYVLKSTSKSNFDFKVGIFYDIDLAKQTLRKISEENNLSLDKEEMTAANGDIYISLEYIQQ